MFHQTFAPGSGLEYFVRFQGPHGTRISEGQTFFPQTIVSAECFAVYHCGSVFWLRTFLEQLSYAQRILSSTSSIAFPELF